ncbi:MAG TPA: PAS domain S-box protein [Methanocella sp.]
MGELRLRKKSTFNDTAKKSEEEPPGKVKALKEENSSLESERELCRQAGWQLQAENRYLSAIADRMRDAAFIVDERGRIKYLNAAAKVFLDGNIADYTGLYLCSIPPLSDDEQFLAKYRQALSAGKEMKFLFNLDHRRWFDVTVQPAGGDRLIFFHDTTIRQLIDERFKFTHFSVNHFRDAVIWVKPDERILSANPAASELLGYPQKELVRMSFSSFIRHIPSGSWPGFWELVKSGEANIFESEVSRSDGNTRPAEISANYLHYQDKELLILIIRDIRERKQAEQALIRSHAQAEAAKEQAELYLDLMGHDINNMNQVGIGFLEMAMETIDLDEEQRELLEKPLETLQKSSRLIQNVRKLQRSRDGNVPVTTVCPGELLEKMTRNFNAPRGRRININLVQRAKCKVIANDLLEDVFSNLIGNAVRHNDGDLTIDIVVEKSAGEGKDYCSVAISDNGHGITDLRKGNLFSRAQKEKYRSSGSGLGLHLVKTLVESYGGKIHVEDRVPGDYKRGAKFVVTIPAPD